VIELVDYGGGNTGSITRCLARLEIPFQWVNEKSLPSGDYPIVLPGVGSFHGVMQPLQRAGLADRIATVVRVGTPYLGICVGLQILLESSEESPGVPGLGLLAGTVKRFQQGKIPQIGWNHVEPKDYSDEPAGHVYFVNAYYPNPTESGVTLYQSEYHGNFCAAIKKGNITAFQFHAEKSGIFGHQLIQRWYDAV